MWLVMHFDTSRNVTYNKVLAGKYQNIRMHTTPHNDQSDDALTTGTFDFYTSPSPPPYSPFGGCPEGGWLRTSVGTYANKTCRDGPYEPNMPECTAYVQPDDSWLDNSIDGFSAACWHFGEQLTDYMEANGEEIVPLGLIGSHWGGTMVEMWQPNATLNAQVCKNDTGHPWEPKQMARWDIGGGGLYNGMVLPFLLRSYMYVQSIFVSLPVVFGSIVKYLARSRYVNTTIKGALWWQGENIVTTSLLQAMRSCIVDQNDTWEQVRTTPFNVTTPRACQVTTQLVTTPKFSCIHTFAPLFTRMFLESRWTDCVWGCGGPYRLRMQNAESD